MTTGRVYPYTFVSVEPPNSKPNLHRQAIEAALRCSWQEAVKINQRITREDPQNIDALNRLAYAYFELGNLKQAKKYYHQTLKYEPYNPIALKNLKVVQAFKKDSLKESQQALPTPISSSSFLYEPGKTKVVPLLKVAEPKKLSYISAGFLVQMVVKQRGITVVDNQGRYLGVLPDDTSFSLIRLIKGGNKYDCVVKSVRLNSLSVVIRETFRSKRFKNQPSFLDQNLYVLPSSESRLPPLEEEG